MARYEYDGEDRLCAVRRTGGKAEKIERGNTKQ